MSQRPEIILPSSPELVHAQSLTPPEQHLEVVTHVPLDYNTANERLAEDGILAYAELVESLRLPTEKQPALVKEIEENLSLAALVKDEQCAAEHVQAARHKRAQLFEGNLAEVFDFATALHLRGSRAGRISLTMEANRLAAKWFNLHYSTLVRVRNAPLYQGDILCHDFLEPRLRSYRPKKPKIPEPKPRPVDLSIREREDGQRYFPALHRPYHKPPVRVTMDGFSGLTAKKPIKGQQQLRIPKTQHENQQEWRDSLGVEVSTPQEITVSKSRNPNAIADLPERQSVLRWMVKKLADHSMNKPETRFRRDFAGFKYEGLVDTSGLQAADAEEAFFLEAKRYPLLTGRGHEYVLAKKIADGIDAQIAIDQGEYQNEAELALLQQRAIEGAGAYSTFYQANLRLVGKIAIRHPTSTTWQVSDSIDVGLDGLRRAIEKFDPEKGFKFSTYVTAWIKQSIMRRQSEMLGEVALPVHERDRLRALGGFIAEHSAAYGTDPDLEVIESAGFREEDLILYRRFMSRERISLDSPLNADASSTLYEVVADTRPSTEDVDLAAFDDTLKEIQEARLIRLIEGARLTDIEKMVLSLRWAIILPGLDYGALLTKYEHEGKPMSMKDFVQQAAFQDGKITLVSVGQAFGLTRERIRQITESSLIKMYVRASVTYMAEAFNFSDEEAELADLYFCLEGQTRIDRQELNAKMNDIQSLLEVINMCEPNVEMFIDEYLHSHYSGDNEAELRHWLRDRFGLGRQQPVWRKRTRDYGLPKYSIHLTPRAEAYVLARLSQTIAPDVTELDHK